MSRIKGFVLVTGCLAAVALSGCRENKTAKVTPKTRVSAEGTGERSRRTLVDPSQNGSHRNGRSLSTAAQNASAAEGQTSATQITGKVSLPDGSPGANADIVLFRLPVMDETNLRGLDDPPTTIAQTRSTQSGEYRLSAELPHTGMLRATLAGFAPEMQHINARRRNKTSRQPMKMNFKLKAGAVLAGRVVNTAGSPVADALIVTAFGGGWTPRQHAQFTTTTATGAFRFDSVSPGNNGIVVEVPDKPDHFERVTAPRSDLLITISDKPAAAVEGKVIAVPGDKPVGGASVVLIPFPAEQEFFGLSRKRECLTDLTGTFRISEIPPGKCMLFATAPEMAPFGQVYRENTFALEPGETSTGLQLKLFAGYMVTGKALDQATSAPLTDVRFWRNGNRKQQHPDAPDFITTRSGEFHVRFFNDWGRPVAEKENWVLANASAWDQIFRNDALIPKDTMAVHQDALFAPAGKVSGVVRAQVGGAVPGALLKVFCDQPRAGDKEITPAPDGAFEIGMPPMSMFRLLASAPQYAPTVSEVYTLKSEPISGLELRLSPGASASGTVQDTSGKPVPDADVRVAFSRLDEMKEKPKPPTTSEPGEDELIHESKTDDAGRFRITGIPASLCYIAAEKSGFAEAPWQEMKLGNGETSEGVVLVLGRTRKISGSISGDDGKPLPGILLYCRETASGQNRGSAEATSDAEGKFVLNDAPETTVSLNTFAEGYERYDEKIGPGREDIKVVLKRKNAFDATVQVVDLVSGKPIPDAVVKQREFYGRMTGKIERDPSSPGRFLIKDVKGEYDVYLDAEAPGYNSANVILGNERLEKKISLTVALEKGGAVKGRVISPDGAPVAGLRVQVYEGQRTPDRAQPNDQGKFMVTGADGRFEIKSVKHGTGYVGIHPRPPQPPVHKPYVLELSQTLDLGDIELTGGAKVTGRLTRGTADEPVPGERIELQTRESRNSVTDKDGTFVFADLSAGSFTITVPSLSVSFHSAYALRSGETVHVPLKVGSAILKGKVVSGGKPVAARISATLGTTSRRLMKRAEAGTDGLFEIRDLPEGTWLMSVSDTANVARTINEQVVIPAEGTVERVFKLTAARMSGRITDAAGKPVARASIWTTYNDDGEQSREDKIRRAAVSAANGDYELNRLPFGKFTIYASSYGVGTAIVRDIELTEQQSEKVVDIRLTPSLGELLLRFTDRRNGIIIENGTCSLVDENGDYAAVTGGGRTSVETPGVLRISAPPGAYIARASAPRYSKADLPVVIESGKTSEVEAMLEPGGSLLWQFIDENGSGIKGVRCSVVPVQGEAQSDNIRAGKTNQWGNWQADGLPPGKYAGTAVLPDGRAVEETFDVPLFPEFEFVTQLK